ncbi:peptidoglycan-binding domain-containing protein [Kitasatospora sp. NPDC093558]|uniref:peptidoglycan-binding domain-containing protein n=1 Tax=Kitasatospora sp. NPDC093558 TaxID=3155201 RepID=UPI0034488AB7
MRKLTRLFASAVVTAAALTTAATPASADPGVPNISYGDHAHGVLCVQHALNRWNVSFGRDSHVIGEDSWFGNDTLREVKFFQDQQGLDADGIVGPRTGNYLLWELQNHLSPWLWLDGCKGYVPSLKSF